MKGVSFLLLVALLGCSESLTAPGDSTETLPPTFGSFGSYVFRTSTAQSPWGPFSAAITFDVFAKNLSSEFRTGTFRLQDIRLYDLSGNVRQLPVGSDFSAVRHDFSPDMETVVSTTGFFSDWFLSRGVPEGQYYAAVGLEIDGNEELLVLGLGAFGIFVNNGLREGGPPEPRHIVIEGHVRTSGGQPVTFASVVAHIEWETCGREATDFANASLDDSGYYRMEATIPERMPAACIEVHLSPFGPFSHLGSRRQRVEVSFAATASATVTVDFTL